LLKQIRINNQRKGEFLTPLFYAYYLTNIPQIMYHIIFGSVDLYTFSPRIIFCVYAENFRFHTQIHCDYAEKILFYTHKNCTFVYFPSKILHSHNFISFFHVKSIFPVFFMYRKPKFFYSHKLFTKKLLTICKSRNLLYIKSYNFQISLLYCSIVLSDEKKPAFEMFTSIFFAQASLFA